MLVAVVLVFTLTLAGGAMAGGLQKIGKLEGYVFRDWQQIEDSPVQALTEESLEKYCGQSFEIESDGETVEVKLMEVVSLGEPVDLGSGTPGPQSQFAAVFEGSGALVAEGIHRLRNANLGELEIYLHLVIPTGEDNAKGPHLEAVFG